MIDSSEFPLFKSLRFINDPKDGIAKSMRSTGELVINHYFWHKLPEEHKYYILAHEEGHILYNTVDEMKADEHASEKYLRKGYSISQSVHALADHLDRNKPVHVARAWAQYQRALKYDYLKNHNYKAFRTNYESVDSIKEKLLRNAT